MFDRQAPQDGTTIFIRSSSCSAIQPGDVNDSSNSCSVQYCHAFRTTAVISSWLNRVIDDGPRNALPLGMSPEQEK